MSKTEYFYLKGKVSWARVHEPDLEYKNWNLKLHLDTPSLDIFNKLKEKDGDCDGILNHLKRDDDGDFVVLKRPTHAKWGGEETALTPPLVLGKDNLPIKDQIGNGSDVTVKLECYKYNKPMKKGKGKAIRLLAVRVDNLIPYQRRDFTEAEKSAIEGLDIQPTQHF